MIKRTRIKICGLTRSIDVQSAVSAGADALGFVFYPPSPRYIRPEIAASLLCDIPPFVTKVGLFVNEDAGRVREIIATTSIDLLQFHGDEEPAYCRQFGRPWIKAARVRAELDLVEYAARFLDEFQDDGSAKRCQVSGRASGILLDAYVDEYGGGGKTFDWNLIPSVLPMPVILSGGLTVQNVFTAVTTVRPWAVDVSSGVEASRMTETGLVAIKGIKDAQKIVEFIAGVRDADARCKL